MKTFRGFASLGIVLLIVMGLAVLGVGGWYALQQGPAPQGSSDIATTTTEASTEPSSDETGFSAVPTSGTGPLVVQFTAPNTGYGYAIDFGDGHTGTIDSLSACTPDRPDSPQYCTHVVEHIYTTPGTYKAHLLVQNNNSVKGSVIITIK